MEQILTSQMKSLDASKITKFFKNQAPPKDMTTPFTDNEFPAKINSIKGLVNQVNFEATQKNASSMPVNIEWKRASDIFKGKTYSVFSDKIEFDDIKQGSVGNCYFLSTISSLSQYPETISRLFRTKEVSPIGYYEVVLFIDGQWQIVIVDDFFVIDEICNDFAFAKPNGNELWVIILEKAWAKVNSGYANTFGGLMSEGYVCLTGCKSETISHEEYNDDTPLFTKILNSSLQRKLICSSTIDKVDESLGLAEHHCYSVLSAHEVKKQDGQLIRLLKLRNPWGKFEWKGDWSDNSEKWTEEMSKLIDYNFSESKDDGVFYISFSDYSKYFNSTSICQIYFEDLVYENYVIDREFINVPQVFNIKLKEKKKVSFSVLFGNLRFNRDHQNRIHPTSLVIAAYDNYKRIGKVTGTFKLDSDVAFTHELEMGNYVVWVYCSLEDCQPKHENYVINIEVKETNTEKTKIVNVGTDNDFLLINKIISSDLIETYGQEISESNNKYYFVKSSENYKNTGLGFFWILNERKEFLFNWIIDSYPSKEQMKILSLSSPSWEKIPAGGNYLALFMKNNNNKIDFKFDNRYDGADLDDPQSEINLERKEKDQGVLNYYLKSSGESSDVEMTEETESPYVEVKKVIYEFERHPVETCDLNALKILKVIEISKGELRLDFPKQMKGLRQYAKNSLKAPNTRYAIIEYEEGTYYGRVDENNKRHGKGTFEFGKDTFYKGLWDRNMVYCGDCIINDRKVYSGLFTDSKRGGCSQCSTYFANGCEFNGFYKNGNLESGTFFWPREPNYFFTMSGEWVEGSKLIKEPKYTITHNFKSKTSYGYTTTRDKYKMKIDENGKVKRLQDDDFLSKTYKLVKSTDTADLFEISDATPKKDEIDEYALRYFIHHGYDNLVAQLHDEDNYKFELDNITISSHNDLTSNAPHYITMVNYIDQYHKTVNPKYVIIKCNKGTYYGSIDENNKIHGKGVFDWGEDTYYYGCWTDNRPDVYGEFYIKKKEVYKGCITKGLIGGGSNFSYYNCANGHRFQANFKDGKLNGKAICYFNLSESSLLEINFKDGHPDGKGMYIQSGSRFKIEYDDGGEMILLQRKI